MSEVSKKWKIYKKNKASKSLGLGSLLYTESSRKVTAPSLVATKEISRKAIAETVLNEIMEEYLLAGALVDKNCNIIETFGDYRKYLQLPEKKFDYNLLKMLSPKASIILGSSFRKAINSNEKHVIRNLRINEQDNPITLTIKPYQDNHGNQVGLILFNDRMANVETINTKDAPDIGARHTDGLTSPDFSDFITLQGELRDTKEILQKAIEEAETTNEELQSTNEELISANEELQSTNEELQSLNEELHTVNAENQLRIKQISELNDDLNNYFSSTDIAQIFLDKQLRIRKYTPQATAIINLIDSDVGRPISHISTNITYKDLTNHIGKVLETSEPIVKIIQITNSSWYQMKILPYLREGKNIDGIVLTFVDITAIKLAEKQLKKANRNLNDLNENLLKSNKELEQFAYITSHDLQEPLRKIQTFVELIQRNKADSSTLDKYLEKITSCASRMSLLVNDVLSYSRLVRTEQRFVETDLNEVLTTVLVDLELLIEQKNATVNGPNLPRVTGIPLQLQQLFSNLISNSIKFCDKSPAIEITALKITDEKEKREKQLNERYDYIKLTFKDNGIGFDQQYADKIFTIFQRLNHKNLYQGTGIGLALCKRIVQNHGGTIFASSELNCGATFAVYLRCV
jgi:two-component system CheB/CheR fusion protein